MADENELIKEDTELSEEEEGTDEEEELQTLPPENE